VGNAQDSERPGVDFLNVEQALVPGKLGETYSRRIEFGAEHFSLIAAHGPAGVPAELDGKLPL